MLRLSSVVSEADDEEWGEDEEMVSTSSTEAVPEAIPSTGKKKLKYVNWPAKYFWSQNAQTPQGSLSLSKKKLTASLLIFQRGSSELSAILAEMANFWAFVVWYKTAQLVSSHLFAQSRIWSLK